MHTFRYRRSPGSCRPRRQIGERECDVHVQRTPAQLCHGQRVSPHCQAAFIPTIISRCRVKCAPESPSSRVNWRGSTWAAARRRERRYLRNCTLTVKGAGGLKVWARAQRRRMYVGRKARRADDRGCDAQFDHNVPFPPRTDGRSTGAVLALMQLLRSWMVKQTDAYFRVGWDSTGLGDAE